MRGRRRVGCPLWAVLAVSLLALIGNACGGGKSTSRGDGGRVLAEGANVAHFEARGFATQRRYRYVVTKVEVFAAGKLRFPPGCGETSSRSNECIDVPGGRPAVVVWLRRPACEPSPNCLPRLSADCGGAPLWVSGTYIWWARDPAGHERRHACVGYAYPHPDPDPAQRTAVMAFAPSVQAPPTHFSLIVEGVEVPLQLS
jgi:hypothetical protein